MKRQIPLAIIFVMGVFTIVTNFIPAKPVADVNQMFRNWYLGIITFFTFLGTINLARVNAEHVKGKSRDWQYSIILLAALAVQLFLGFYKWSPDALREGSPFMYVYFNLQFPLESTMYSLLAFFMTSASFRAFRARNKEALLLAPGCSGGDARQGANRLEHLARLPRCDRVVDDLSQCCGQARHRNRD